jgi:excisionase family DNA binding protein
VAQNSNAEQSVALTYTVPEVAAKLGLSRNACYEAIGRGEIPSLRFGRRVVIPRAAFERMLDAGASKGATA